MKNIIVLFFLFMFSSIYSQREFENWYFGNQAGVTFISGNPVALTDGAMLTTEGVATISDGGGNLLLYTDGLTVYNRNHNVMVNGAGLLGDNSSTQSSIIIQKPLSNDIYYIFTTDDSHGSNGIRYTEVDMNMFSGLGSVTAIKNILLHTPSCEKLTTVKHCNNEDIWVISHDWNSSNFRCWLVTSAGVNITPIVSGAGSVIDGIEQSSFGYLKSNIDGSKLISAYYGFLGNGENKVELCDFNNSTGTVSNGFILSNETGPYGVEFSPNGKVAYAATNQGRLIQYDLCDGSNTDVQNSRFQLFNLGPFIGALQLGPDGKIYVSRNTTFLSVINNPNTLGLGCNFVNNAVSLAGRISTFGLPNFAPHYLRNRKDFTYIVDCLEVQFSTPDYFQGICNQVSDIQGYLWDFGDGTTSNEQNPTHIYLSEGNYNVTLELNHTCYNSILNQSINLAGIIPSVTTTITQP